MPTASERLTISGTVFVIASDSSTSGEQCIEHNIYGALSQYGR